MPILIIPYWDSSQSPIRKCEVYMSLRDNNNLCLNLLKE